jgi:molecular chaperone HtpG
MNVEQRRLKEGSENEYETVVEEQTLNSMVPLWRRNKSEITEEEYNNFYQEKFYDFTKPLR